MNKYPGFIPPGSGSIKTVYAEYPFATPTHHLGPYNNMDWDKSKTSKPLSDYHPFYLHHINDSLLTLRDPANAATIELGVGKHISDIAKFANSTNLGYANQRVGVAYFKQLGISGNASWWSDTNALQTLTVNSGIAAELINTDRVVITSGYFSKASKFTVDASNTSLAITSAGSGYIDKIEDVARRWIFSYGSIKTLDDVSMLNGELKIFNEASGVITTSGSITFKNVFSVRDLTLNRGLVSGFFDTYLRNGVSDNGLITYSTVGHKHDASGWMNPTGDSMIVGNTIFDGRYYYAVGENNILEMDSLGTKENWIPTRISSVTFDSNTRVFKDSTNINIVNSNWVPHVNSFKYTDKYNGRLGDKVATINDLVIYGNIGSDTLNIIDGRTFKLSSPITLGDEFYFINDSVYFVHVDNGQIVIYNFNGKVWKQWNVYIQGTFINSCVSNSEIFIAHKINTTLLGITRFINTGTSRMVNTFTLFGEPKKVVILDHDMVCLVKNFPSVPDRWSIPDRNYSLYLYNLNNSAKYQRLFYNAINQAISIYSNSQYIFVQIGDFKRKILKNKSTNLSLDAVGGLYDLKGEIRISDSLKTKSLVIAMCADSLFREDNYIYKHIYLLEPGRIGDEMFNYTGDFGDTYISRYVFNQEFSDAHTYNDQTCSILFNGAYYFGHRGDISSFLKTGNTFKLATPTKLDNIVVVKFLPLDKSFYALVQDFNNASVDYVYSLPTSPYASETDGSNFIPYHPGPWSVPITKLYVKDKSSNIWKEDTKYTERYGRNIIDATAHDNNIYLLAHSPNNVSGIVSAKYSYNSPDPTGMLLSFSGNLTLNESLVGPGMDTTMYEFTTTVDGRYVKDGVTYASGVSPDVNGHHEFYLYNHPTGPYVVHDQVEVLYDTIAPSSIYGLHYDGYPNGGYVMANTGNRYNYRTLSVTFLRQELPRPTRINSIYDKPVAINPLDINNPTIKIPIGKDHPQIIDSRLEVNKYNMKSLAQDKDCTRRNIHFVTSITHNKNIYLLTQVDQTLKIYCVREFGDYIYMTPNTKGTTNDYNIPNFVSGVATIFGEGLSYVGIKTNIGYAPYLNSDSANVFFLDFVPCELSNTLVTELNINDVIGFNAGSVYILGDGDDLFIQKSRSTKYRNHKRFSTHSSMSIGSTIYVPITVRVNHPTGRLYTFVLGFFNDGSVGLVDNDNVPIQIVNKPTGRTQCIYNNGKYVISSIKLTDDAQEYISYRDIKNDPVYGTVLQSAIPQVFNTLYNPFAKKKWIIGEYDITVNDNLNVRETY